jgi:hypothetical protein
MRKFLLVSLVLGFAVTANGQTGSRYYYGETFRPMRGQFPDGLASISGEMRRDDQTIYYRNLVITFDPTGRRVELRAAEASSPSDGSTMTLSGPVTLTIPSLAQAAPTTAQ